MPFSLGHAGALLLAVKRLPTKARLFSVLGELETTCSPESTVEEVQKHFSDAAVLERILETVQVVRVVSNIVAAAKGLEDCAIVAMCPTETTSSLKAMVEKERSRRMAQVSQPEAVPVPGCDLREYLPAWCLFSTSSRGGKNDSYLLAVVDDRADLPLEVAPLAESLPPAVSPLDIPKDATCLQYALAKASMVLDEVVESIAGLKLPNLDTATLTVTGHGMGGAIAAVLGMMLSRHRDRDRLFGKHKVLSISAPPVIRNGGRVLADESLHAQWAVHPNEDCIPAEYAEAVADYYQGTVEHVTALGKTVASNVATVGETRKRGDLRSMVQAVWHLEGWPSARLDLIMAEAEAAHCPSLSGRDVGAELKVLQYELLEDGRRNAILIELLGRELKAAREREEKYFRDIQEWEVERSKNLAALTVLETRLHFDLQKQRDTQIQMTKLTKELERKEEELSRAQEQEKAVRDTLASTDEELSSLRRTHHSETTQLESQNAYRADVLHQLEEKIAHLTKELERSEEARRRLTENAVEEKEFYTTRIKLLMGEKEEERRGRIEAERKLLQLSQEAKENTRHFEREKRGEALTSKLSRARHEDELAKWKLRAEKAEHAAACVEARYQEQYHGAVEQATKRASELDVRLNEVEHEKNELESKYKAKSEEATLLAAEVERLEQQLAQQQQKADEMSARYIESAAKGRADRTTSDTRIALLEEMIDDKNRRMGALREELANVQKAKHEHEREATAALQTLQREFAEQLQAKKEQVEELEADLNKLTLKHAELEELHEASTARAAAEKEKLLAEVARQAEHIKELDTAIGANVHFRILEERASKLSERVQHLERCNRALSSKMESQAVHNSIISTSDRDALLEASQEHSAVLREAKIQLHHMSSVVSGLLLVVEACDPPLALPETLTRDIQMWKEFDKSAAPINELNTIRAITNAPPSLAIEDCPPSNKARLAPLPQTKFVRMEKFEGSPAKGTLQHTAPGLPPTVMGTVDTSLYYTTQRQKLAPMIRDVDW